MLAPSVTVTEQHVVGNVRTVVMTRALAGKSKDYYSFNPAAQSTIPFITAIGANQAWPQQHQAHANDVITLANPVDAATCLCDLGAEGKLCNSN